MDGAVQTEQIAPASEVEQALPSSGEGQTGRRRTRFLMRGEAVIASVGIALATILLTAIAGASWWLLDTQRAADAAAQAQRVQTVGELLSQAAETLLVHEELTTIRRIVADLGAGNDLSCRVLLSDGRILASTTPSEINIASLPAQWTRSLPLDEEPAAAPAGAVQYLKQISIPKRGVAEIKVTALAARSLWSYWEAQTGIAGIGAVAMMALLVVYRRMRWRMRGIGAVREALLAAAAGETCPSALLVGHDLGPEATSWNELIAAKERLNKAELADRARETLGRRGSSKGDLSAACDAMSQGLVLVDEGGRIAYANGAAAVFLHAARDQLSGAAIETFLEVEKVLASIRGITSGSARGRAVMDIERKGNHAGVFRFTVRPVRREDSASAMVTIEDITQQKVAEEARNAFVAQATHELRTPLTNIRLYVETAIEDGEADPASRARCLNVINGETRRLERIVSEMLSVAEMEAGSFKLKTAEVRLEALFQELRADYEQQAKEKEIALVFNLPPKLPAIKGDRDKIMLALHNLVGNALKYTPTKGQVSVSVELDAAAMVVSVADSGIGISPEDADKIFERFYRASDQRVSKITGTGLGLTIAREVVRLHGGDISVESQLNKGSTFTMTLPVKAEAA